MEEYIETIKRLEKSYSQLFADYEAVRLEMVSEVDKNDMLQEDIQREVNKNAVLSRANDDLKAERCELRTQLYQILTQIPDDLVESKCKKLYPQLKHDCGCGCD